MMSCPSWGFPTLMTAPPPVSTAHPRSAATDGGMGRRQAMSSPAPDHTTMQLTLFAPPSPVVTAIRELDVESLSPLEALTKLFVLKRQADGQSVPDA